MAKSNNRNISSKRLRKIEHIKSLRGQEGWSNAKIRRKAIHFMKMDGDDLVTAFEGKLYDE